MYSFYLGMIGAEVMQSSPEILAPFIKMNKKLLLNT